MFQAKRLKELALIPESFLTDTYITITTNDSELKIVGRLNSGETLVIDSALMTAKVVDANGDTLRDGLPLLSELNFPALDVGANTVTLAQGVGGQKATFPNAMYAGDDVALLASTRECKRNGSAEPKNGFFQYSAAWDSKHIVSLPQGKSAQLLYSMQEMDDGEPSVWKYE